MPASMGKPELCCEPGSGQATQQLWQKPCASWYHCHAALSPPPLLLPFSEGSHMSCPSPQDARGYSILFPLHENREMFSADAEPLQITMCPILSKVNNLILFGN